MISIVLSHNYPDTPTWWQKITADLPSPDPVTWADFKRTVDLRLIAHGGRYRQEYIGKPIWITFRDPAAYTAFLLRFA